MCNVLVNQANCTLSSLVRTLLIRLELIQKPRDILGLIIKLAIARRDTLVYSNAEPFLKYTVALPLNRFVYKTSQQLEELVKIIGECVSVK